MRFISLLCLSLALAFAPSAAHVATPDGLHVASSAAPAAAAPDGARNAELGHLPLRFEENVGQAPAPSRFLARGTREAVLLAPSQTEIRLGGPQHTVVRMEIVGARADAAMEGVEPLPGRSHYLIGRDPAGWRTGVRTYASVATRDLYPGIDLVHHGATGELEYDFVVAPGVDPACIRLRFAADSLTIEPTGELVVRAGSHELREPAPTVYQEVDGTRRPVDGSWRRAGSREVAFSLGAFDRTRPLVIDPILRYSTYFGSPGDENPNDDGAAVAVDAEGSAFVVGITDSIAFPTVQALRPGFAGGNYDLVLFKLNPSGTGVAYSTYFGGTGDDFARSIAVDASGNVYVTGQTTSPDFPMAAALQSTYGGGPDDGFVAKIDATGSVVLFSTYFGGSGNDTVNDIAVGPAGNVHLVGATGSTNFPTTATPFQAVFAGGSLDAFVAKLDPRGTPLLYSTYLGGTGSDAARSVAVDAANRVYVAGGTESLDFPTQGAVQSTNHGGFDAFLAKLDETSSTLTFSTYLGGTGTDFAIGLAIDDFGSAVVAGNTNSANFPVANALQPTFGGGLFDAFIAKLPPSGSPLLYATYFGGVEVDDVHAVTSDASGGAWVAGHTESTGLTLVNPFQATHGGGFLDAWLVHFAPSGMSVVMSTYLGGSGNDGILGVAVQPSGDAILVGATTSTNFPTSSPIQATNAGHSDLFVAALRDPGPEVTVRLANGGASKLLTMTLSNLGTQPRPVDLKLWIDAPSLGLLIPLLPSAITITLPASFGPTNVLNGIALPALLPFPGTRVGAALVNPVTGQQMSRSVCLDAPCN